MLGLFRKRQQKATRPLTPEELQTIALLNDTGGDPKIPADVSVWRSEEALCNYLEHWFVEEPHLALNLAGEQIVLSVESGRVVTRERRPYPNGPEIVQRRLAYLSRLEADAPVEEVLARFVRSA